LWIQVYRSLAVSGPGGYAFREQRANLKEAQMETTISLDIGLLAENLDRIRSLLVAFEATPVGQRSDVAAAVRAELDRPLNLQVELAALRYLLESWH
jgi:hypothetical protein